MKALDTIAGVDDNPAVAALEGDSVTPEQKLDLVLWYLRDVHSHCYYTCTKLWWQWETQRRPPAPKILPETPSNDDGASADAGADESKAQAKDATAESSEKLENPDLDDGEVEESDNPKPAADAANGNKGEKKRKKSGAYFGDRLGLGSDVHGLASNWAETLDKRCAKLIESAATSISEAEYLAK